jgi:hypothetical protein
MLPMLMGMGASLVSQGVGGLLGALGPSLGKTFGLGDAMQGATNQATDDTIAKGEASAQRLMGQMNWNAMGQTGASARLGAANALGSDWRLGTTAGRRALLSGYDAQKQLAGVGAQQTGLANQLAQQQMGRLTNTMGAQARASGAPLAALSKIAREGGGALSDALSKNLISNAGILSQNIGAGNQALQQGTQTRAADVAQMYQTDVVPFLNKHDPGAVAGLAGNLVNAGVNAGQTAGQTMAMTNPLAGVSAGLGQLGTQLGDAAGMQYFFNGQQNNQASTMSNLMAQLAELSKQGGQAIGPGQGMMADGSQYNGFTGYL